VRVLGPNPGRHAQTHAIVGAIISVPLILGFDTTAAAAQISSVTPTGFAVDCAGLGRADPRAAPQRQGRGGTRNPTHFSAVVR
jgi:hypothetical protein